MELLDLHQGYTLLRISKRHIESRVTQIVTKRYLFPEVYLQPEIDEFRQNVEKMTEQRKCLQLNILILIKVASNTRLYLTELSI